ncbi:hypothetical protein [Candidatus Cardinium hertigii]|nr:hypothetical protein [Candidatus Cardinium hertigii]
MALASSSTTYLCKYQEKIDDPELMQLVNENKLKNNRYWTVEPNIDIHIHLHELHNKYMYTFQLQNLLGRLVAYLCKEPCYTLTIDCRYVHSSGKYLYAILAALKGTTVRSLCLKRANLGAVEALGTVFSKLKYTKIEDLQLANNKLENNVAALLPTLVCTAVHTLNLCNNNLGLVQADLLGTAFSILKYTKIKNLQLANNKLANNVAALLPALIGTAVHTLNLCNNDLGLVKTEPLGTAFSTLKHTKVEDLKLGGNKLANSVATLLPAFVGTSVRTLDLCDNDLGLVEAETLGTAFSALEHTEIENLKLGCNKLENNVAVLLPALVGNTTLCCLDLDSNDLGSVELPTLDKAFSSLQHTAIDSLSFDTGSFISWDLSSMKQLLAALRDTQIRNVFCLGPEGSRNLVESFNSNIAYPHDTVYHEHGLQRACIRTIMPNNSDLNAARSNRQLKKTIKEYESDKPGLDIISMPPLDEVYTTDEDIENPGEEEEEAYTTDEDTENSDEDEEEYIRYG